MRKGYFDSLVTDPSLSALRAKGTVGEVAVDQTTGFPAVCAEPAGSDTSRVCVQENGFVTQWRSGATKIGATSVRIGAKASDLKAPA